MNLLLIAVAFTCVIVDGEEVREKIKAKKWKGKEAISAEIQGHPTDAPLIADFSSEHAFRAERARKHKPGKLKSANSGMKKKLRRQHTIAEKLKHDDRPYNVETNSSVEIDISSSKIKQFNEPCTRKQSKPLQFSLKLGQKKWFKRQDANGEEFNPENGPIVVPTGSTVEIDFVSDLCSKASLKSKSLRTRQQLAMLESQLIGKQNKSSHYVVKLAQKKRLRGQDMIGDDFNPGPFLVPTGSTVEIEIASDASSYPGIRKLDRKHISLKLGQKKRLRGQNNVTVEFNPENGPFTVPTDSIVEVDIVEDSHVKPSSESCVRRQRGNKHSKPYFALNLRQKKRLRKQDKITVEFNPEKGPFVVPTETTVEVDIVDKSGLEQSYKSCMRNQKPGKQDKIRMSLKRGQKNGFRRHEEHNPGASSTFNFYSGRPARHDRKRRSVNHKNLFKSNESKRGRDTIAEEANLKRGQIVIPPGVTSHVTFIRKVSSEPTPKSRKRPRTRKHKLASQVNEAHKEFHDAQVALHLLMNLQRDHAESYKIDKALLGLLMGYIAEHQGKIAVGYSDVGLLQALITKLALMRDEKIWMKKYFVQLITSLVDKLHLHMENTDLGFLSPCECECEIMNGVNGGMNGHYEMSGGDIITQNQLKGCWTIGLINSKFRYLTAETFGFKINANGSSLKKKQIWTLEPNAGDSLTYLKSHLDKYLAVDSFGNVTCEADEKDPGSKFQISVADDGSGRWAFRNVVRGYFLGASSDKLTCTAKVPGDAELWLIHLAARPQVNLRSIGRKRFAHLSETLDEIHVDANIPWGEDTLFTLEFRIEESGKYALHTCNNKYLSREGKLVDTCNPNCLFSAEYHQGALALRDRSGAYLSPIGSKAVLKTRSQSVTKDELFSLEDSLPQASFVAALNSRYVSVKQGVDVTANQDEISDHETFQLEFDWSTKRWYIRTMQDRYWTLETGGGIQACGNQKSSNALFDLVWQGDGSLCFRANNGKLVQTKRSGHLYANTEQVEDACKYFFYLINRPILVLKCEQGFVGYKSNSSTKLECNKATYETIQVERAEKGVVYFKGQNNRYWHVDSECVTADAEVPEGFYLELREPTRICIKSVHGGYLVANKNGTFRLGDDQYENATKWEY